MTVASKPGIQMIKDTDQFDRSDVSSKKLLFKEDLMARRLI